jgi:paraquat-inducible protein B
MNAFKKLVEGKCPNEKSKSVFCTSKIHYEQFKTIGRNYIKQAEENETQAKKDEAYNSSPAGIKDQACILFIEIQNNQEIINRERKIGKTSGVVDQVALHKAGSNIVDLNAQLAPLKNEFKRLTKKEINHKQCD